MFKVKEILQKAEELKSVGKEIHAELVRLGALGDDLVGSVDRLANQVEQIASSLKNVRQLLTDAAKDGS